MAGRTALLANVRKVLSERWFTEAQIEKILPRLQDEYFKKPEVLHEVIDTWNSIMRTASDLPQQQDELLIVPHTAKPPQKSLLNSMRIDMNTILSDVEPDLLLLSPQKLRERHSRIQGLKIANNLAEAWLLLFNAPRGYYLQDWVELTKKIYYIEQNLLDFLYDRKEQKGMVVHPLVKHAASVELNFDHIRSRYLFAMRCGYKALSHMYSVQSALDRATLGDLILADNERFLKRFAPFCSNEEYDVFSNLIKNHDQDEDDAQIFEKLAELNSIRH